MNFDVYNVSDEYSNVRLDKWIKIIYSAFRQNDIEIALRKKKIKVNEKKIKSNHRIQIDDQISISSEYRNLKKEKKYHFNRNSKKEIDEMIIYQDDELLILNKPPGIAVQGGTKIKKSIDTLLKSSFKSLKTRLVHRLDKDTSGILIIALNRQIADHMSYLFREKEITKNYWALNVGKIKIGKGTINKEIKKKNSKTYYKALTEYNNYMKINNNLNFIIFKPITGRNHQIRIHSKELGIPILGDKRYGNLEDSEKLHLHSRSVEFYHPNGNKMFFEAELPKHMREKWKKYDLPYEVNI
ncbi:MAG: RluA family pseudouridine synthase [Alphaproteobacteria bacterium]